MYAITCHKSQGPTLPAVVLHSSKEFVPGLMYVSLTRVKSCSNLQIIGFNPNQLLQPIPECVNVCAAHSDPLDGEIGCCRNKVLDDEYSRITDGCAKQHPISLQSKLEGVSSLNNFHYGEECLTVWKAFDVGEGKTIPWSQLQGKRNISWLLLLPKFYLLACFFSRHA